MKEPKFKLTWSGIDHCFYERTFVGRLTKQRYKIISRFCRKHTQSFECGHSYDCCGCVSSQRLTITYKANKTIIEMKRIFNY